MTQGLLTGSEVIARRDFQSTTTGHLSFFKGDILTIIEDNADDNVEWYQAQDADGKKGLVPISHLQRRTEVKLNMMPWFHGKITRDEAEKLLQPPKVSNHEIPRRLKLPSIN
jgi:c-src tyrosine kinase